MKNKILSHELLITNNNDIDLKIKEFILVLNQEWEKHNQNINTIKHEWEKILESNEIHIEPEKLRNKSPITILDAPWGAGKTFFIEQLVKKFSIKKNLFEKNNKIEKIIVIDVWNYLNFEKISYEIVKNIWLTLSKWVGKKDKKNWKIIKKIWNVIGPILIAFGIYVVNEKTNENISVEIANFTPQFSEEEEKEKIDFDKIKIPFTLITIDNIERIGKKSWEIIKTIQKLSELDGFIFVLSMNKSKIFFENYNTNDFEDAIDKYITLGTYFKLKQKYNSILETNKIKNKYIPLINSILETEISGEILSIRYIENILKKENIKESFDKNKYYGLEKIKNIWNPENIIQKTIKEDVSNFYNFLSEIDAMYSQTKIYLKNEINKIINFYNQMSSYPYYKNIEFISFEQIKKELINNDYSFIKNFSFNWEKEWKDQLFFLNNIIEDLSLQIDSIEEEINKNNKIILNLDELIKNNLSNLKIKKEKVDEINNLDANKKTSSIIKKLSSYKQNITDLQQTLQEQKNLKTKHHQEIDSLNDLKNRWLNFLNTNAVSECVNNLKIFIDFYNQIKSEYLEDEDNKFIFKNITKKYDELKDNDKSISPSEELFVEILNNLIEGGQ